MITFLKLEIAGCVPIITVSAERTLYLILFLCTCLDYKGQLQLPLPLHLYGACYQN